MGGATGHDSGRLWGGTEWEGKQRWECSKHTPVGLYRSKHENIRALRTFYCMDVAPQLHEEKNPCPVPTAVVRTSKTRHTSETLNAYELLLLSNNKADDRC